MYYLIFVRLLQITSIAATTACVCHWLKSRELAGNRQSFILKKKKKREGFTCILIGGHCPREARGEPTTKSATFVVGLEVVIWFSLVGSELEAEAKDREASSYWPSLESSALVAAKFVVWFSGFCRFCGSEFYHNIQSGTVCLYICSFNFSGFKQQQSFIIFHGFSGSGIQKQPSWTVLAQTFPDG